MEPSAKPSLIGELQKRVMRMQGGKSSILLVALLLFIPSILAQFLPASAIVTVMIMIMNALSQDGEVCPSRMLLPIAALSCLWIGKLPIGFGATTHITPNKYISAYKSTQLLGIFDYAKVSIIPLLIRCVFMAFAYKWLPKRNIDEGKLKKVSENAAIPKKHEMIIYFTFVMVMGSMFMSSLLGDYMYIVPAVGTLLLVFTGAMSEKETKVILSSDILYMLAGVFVMADALAKSGAGAAIGKTILTLLGGHPSGLAVMFAFGGVSLIITQFMSNSGAKNILLPMAVATCVTAGYDPRGVVILVDLMCSTAILFPMASPSAAIAFAAAGYKLKETLPFSIVLMLLCLLSGVFAANFVFPIFG